MEVSGEQILIVEIEELDRPCAVDYRYYARVGTSVKNQLFEELKQRFD
jgi:predicted HTH transcriptional regulator